MTVRFRTRSSITRTQRYIPGTAGDIASDEHPIPRHGYNGGLGLAFVVSDDSWVDSTIDGAGDGAAV